MASTTGDERSEGVEFIHEDDGSVTARDLETGIQRGGETRGEALQQLAEVLILEAGGGEPIEDEEAFLHEVGLDPEEIEAAREENDELPEFMR
jgi:hypothetical protein